MSLMTTSGKDLKLERVAADVQANVLADRMKVSRSTLWHIEKAALVTDQQAADYRSALATFGDVATSSKDAA